MFKFCAGKPMTAKPIVVGFAQLKGHLLLAGRRRLLTKKG
jgi:hypothetical protein